MKKRTILFFRLLCVLLVFLVSHSNSILAKPYSANEISSIQSEREAKIQQIRIQEIKQTRNALLLRSPVQRKAELYYRLAELYLESYRAEFLLEGRAHEKRIEKGERGQSIDRTRSMPYLKYGVQACEEILRFKISFSKMDHVLYFLAFYQSELGNTQKSVGYYQRLAAEFPASPFAVESYRELGQSSFRAGKFSEAEKYFEITLKQGLKNNSQKNSELYHRLAWCSYRLKNYAKAIERMKKAVEVATDDSEKFLSIREEALRDLAIFYTETGQVSEAIRYFRSAAGSKEYYPLILERLGKQYEKSAQPQKAIQVYDSLLRTQPDAESAYRVTVKWIDLELRAKKFDKALELVKKTKVISDPQPETKVAQQNLKAMIRKTATESHEIFQKKGDRAALVTAESYYAIYLERLLPIDEAAPERNEIKMYLAEVKRALGKSDEASLLYKEVLKSKDARYAKEAGVLWVSSLSQTLKSNQKTNAESLSKGEKEFIEAADELDQNLPKAQESREASLRAAQILAAYTESKEESLARLQKLIERDSGSEQAVMAARLWLQLLAELKSDPEKIESTLNSIRSNKELLSADQKLSQKPNRKAEESLLFQIQEQERRLKISRVAQFEKNQDFSAAGQGYLEVARRSGDATSAETAYRGALKSYVKLEDTVAVQKVFSEWSIRFAQSQKPQDSLRAEATQFFIAGKFFESARLFSILGEVKKDVSALDTAFAIARALGKNEQVLAMGKMRIQLAHAGSDRNHALIQQARILEKMQQEPLAGKLYLECFQVKAIGQLECAYRLADLYRRLKDRENEITVLRKATQISSKDSPYLGAIFYRLAELTEGAQEKVKLELPMAQLQKQLQKKIHSLQVISQAYQRAASASGPWAVAALNRLAQWAWNFADEVARLQQEDPSTQKALSPVILQVREKAVTYWRQALDEASRHEILSPVMPEVQDSLVLAHQSHEVTQVARAQGVQPHWAIVNRGEVIQQVRQKLEAHPDDATAWNAYGVFLFLEKQQGLAEIAFQRALALQPQLTEALNHEAVNLLVQAGPESWFEAGRALTLFNAALSQDSFFVQAKINKAYLFNYYRLFTRSRAIWDQVLVKKSDAEYHDGLAIALQGNALFDRAEESFKKADQMGADEKRFARLYHRAALEKSKAACRKNLEAISNEGLFRFEAESVSRLKEVCQ